MNIPHETPSTQPLPEVVSKSLREFIGDDEQVETILADGQFLEPIATTLGTSYPVAYEHPSTEDGVRVHDIFLVDIDNSNNFTGFGDVSYVEGDPSISVKEKPYVAYTETASAAQGQGLGTQRLRMMNALSLEYFGHALHSDPSGDTTDEAHRLWEKLTEAGETEAYSEDGLTRYRFSQDSAL